MWDWWRLSSSSLSDIKEVTSKTSGWKSVKQTTRWTSQPFWPIKYLFIYFFFLPEIKLAQLPVTESCGTEAEWTEWISSPHLSQSHPPQEPSPQGPSAHWKNVKFPTLLDKQRRAPDGGGAAVRGVNEGGSVICSRRNIAHKHHRHSAGISGGKKTKTKQQDSKSS